MLIDESLPYSQVTQKKKKMLTALRVVDKKKEKRNT